MNPMSINRYCDIAKKLLNFNIFPNCHTHTYQVKSKYYHMKSGILKIQDFGN